MAQPTNKRSTWLSPGACNQIVISALACARKLGSDENERSAWSRSTKRNRKMTQQRNKYKLTKQTSTIKWHDIQIKRSAWSRSRARRGTAASRCAWPAPYKPYLDTTIINNSKSNSNTNSNSNSSNSNSNSNVGINSMVLASVALRMAGASAEEDRSVHGSDLYRFNKLCKYIYYVCIYIYIYTCRERQRPIHIFLSLSLYIYICIYIYIYSTRQSRGCVCAASVDGV